MQDVKELWDSRYGAKTVEQERYWEAEKVSRTAQKAALTPRERVRLALAHQETDRIPIAMVCSGVNPAARRDLAAYLKEHRQTTIEQYLDPLIDIQGVWPGYCGPALAPATDWWGVRRSAVSYGLGEYQEIDYYPPRMYQEVSKMLPLAAMRQ